MKFTHLARTSAFGAGLALGAAAMLSASALADNSKTAVNCPVSYGALKSALALAVQRDGSGFALQMWATAVNRDGVVCAVAFTGSSRGSQWPGSRVISAQKANAANAFSLDGLALSTANLYSAVQPGGSLYGLQESNPVDPSVAYGGNAAFYGAPNDPMVGGKIGGINVFGGGLGLYNSRRQIVGGIGVSGDTSCRDHNVAWHARNILRLDNVSNGPAAAFAGDATHPDNIIFDLNDSPAPTVEGKRNLSTSGFGHPRCFNSPVPPTLPPVPTVTAQSSQ